MSSPSRKVPRVRNPVLLPVLGCVLLAALLLLPPPIYTWWAKRAFDRHVTGMEAAGEALDIESLKPAPISPGQTTFARHPLIRELFAESAGRADLEPDPDLRMDRLSVRGMPGTMNKGASRKPVRYFGGKSLPEFSPPLGEEETARAILAHCEAVSRDLDAFAEAARLPVSHFELGYEKGFALSVPELRPLQNLAELVALRAQARLILGKPAEAADDALTLLALSRHLGEEPNLIFQLVHDLVNQGAVGVVHEGLQRSAWGTPELERLAQGIGDPDIDVGYLKAMRMERAVFVDQMRLLTGEELFSLVRAEKRFLRAVVPTKGWSFDNARRFSEIFQQSILTDESGSARHSGFPLASMEDSILAISRNPLARFRYLLASLSLPAYDQISTRLLRTQVYFDHARLALALESHRLARGSYPNHLSDLGSDLPLTDPFGGADYRYGVLPDGGYRLHSIGPNRRDEGGRLRRELDQGDWVWVLSLPEDFDPEEYSRNDPEE